MGELKLLIEKLYINQEAMTNAISYYGSDSLEYSIATGDHYRALKNYTIEFNKVKDSIKVLDPNNLSSGMVKVQILDKLEFLSILVSNARITMNIEKILDVITNIENLIFKYKKENYEPLFEDEFGINEPV